MRTQAPSARPVGVLIASPQEWTSRSLASILAPQGYRVLKAYTRGQALAHIRRSPPDAIIIDEQLPDGDGHALCRDLYDQDMISPSTPVERGNRTEKSPSRNAVSASSTADSESALLALPLLGRLAVRGVLPWPEVGAV